jgi:hypothetical protein
MKKKLLLAAMALGIVSMAQAQADWTLRTPTHAPPKRIQTAMAQTAGGRLTVLFGGLNLGPAGVFNQHNVLGDTWFWNGTDWTQFTGAAPPARFGATMALNPGSGNALLFGGKDANGNFLSDTWEFHVSEACTKLGCSPFGFSWSKLTPAATPPARAFASMSIASTGVVLSGGENASGELGDTWFYDPSVSNWVVQLGGVSPARSNTAMAECQNVAGATSTTLAMEYGGGHPTFELGDSWYWGTFVEGLTSRVWQGPIIPATRPLPRSSHAMAYYPVSGNDVLYGGEFFATEIAVIVEGDTWNGNCLNGTVNWSQAAPAHSPGTRMLHAMSKGPSGLSLVLFGGTDVLPGGSLPNGRDHNDTWTWGRKIACVPVDGSTLREDQTVSCLFDSADGSHFAGWKGRGFDPEFQRQEQTSFKADDSGPATITAEWSDGTGFHTQTFSYTIVGH